MAAVDRRPPAVVVRRPGEVRRAVRLCGQRRDRRHRVRRCRGSRGQRRPGPASRSAGRCCRQAHLCSRDPRRATRARSGRGAAPAGCQADDGGGAARAGRVRSPVDQRGASQPVRRPYCPGDPIGDPPTATTRRTRRHRRLRPGVGPAGHAGHHRRRCPGGRARGRLLPLEGLPAPHPAPPGRTDPERTRPRERRTGNRQDRRRAAPRRPPGPAPAARRRPAGPDLARRVDVVNIDKLARRVVDEAGRDQRVVTTDAKAITQWRELLAEVGETRWDADFLAAEWSQVILGQVLDSFPDYARVRRAGRGHPLTRADRKTIWQLAERFSRRLDERGLTTHAATAARAAHLEAEHSARLATGEHTSSRRGHRYTHIVVDEGQDLHPAHWKMLRAMVAPAADDLFILADSHQRIYDNVVSLGSLGINIRGRSARLTLNYRTTKQNLGWAVRLLHGQTYDNLDGGFDTLTGYRSILRGTAPVLRGFPTADQELDQITDQITEIGRAHV